MNMPILCIDFDGVIHSYKSGWKGPRNIPDPPVDGALRFIVEALDYFDVYIFSSRSNYWFGRRAMKKWLYDNLVDCHDDWWGAFVHAHNTTEPWDTAITDTASYAVNKIKFPLHKPPALVTIDDRAICFSGIFPSIGEIKDFKPWNKK